MSFKKSDGDELFTNATFDSSNPEKIIIREKSVPKKKVRRRVKKGTKEQILLKRAAIKNADKVKVSRKSDELDFVDLNNGKADTGAFKMPRLSEIEKKKEAYQTEAGSDFRKASADWRDNGPDYSGLDGLSNGLGGGRSKTTPIQWVALALAGVLFISSILTTNVYAKYECLEKKNIAMAQLSSYEDTTFEQVAMAVESVEAPVSLEEAKPQLGKVLSLVLTSVEKDLKIKLVDEDDTLVKNVPWSVTVSDSDGNNNEQSDDDQDGIIHITDISAGDYSVTLNPSDELSEYEMPSMAQSVSVKAKVEYKVISNIKEEIKSEKEVNVAAEDAAGNQAAEAETAPPALTDTVEFVESTQTVNGEDYVEATPDISKTASIKQSNKLVAILDNIKRSTESKIASNAGLLYTAILPENDDETPAPTDPPADPPADPLAHTCSLSYEKKDGTNHITRCSDGCTAGYPKDEAHDFGGDGSGQECSKCHEPNSNVPCKHTGTPIYVQVGDSKHDKKCPDCGTVLEAFASCSYVKNNVCDCGRSKPAEATIALNKTSISLTVGASDTITATVTPSGNASFSSSDASIASVDGSGKVTAVKAGKATITASANGKTAVCAVTVTAAPEAASITLSGSTSIKVGETTTITAAIKPDGKVITLAKVSDQAIAAVSVSGNAISVKGLKGGSTTLSVSSDNGKEATITINVTETDKYSDDAQLYDAAMNALYVREGDIYRLAKYRDYKNNPSQKFYRKQESFLYTGWQTIDGQKCYFDKNHNKVTGKQIIGGVEYDFGNEGSMSSGSGSLGIDVSKYQPSINWAAVKASGVDYAIIRCGYRGSSTGVLIEDPYFKSHIKGAKAAGLKVGVYFFTTALTEAEAVEEASMCAYLCNGYGLDFPIFMDCESSPRPGYNGMSAGQRTAVIKAFCNTIRSAGYTPGVYANKTWFTSYIHAGELSGYKIWLAQYNAAGPTYSGRYDMWQYTSKGSVNGISGYVDMNKCYYR